MMSHTSIHESKTRIRDEGFRNDFTISDWNLLLVLLCLSQIQDIKPDILFSSINAKKRQPGWTDMLAIRLGDLCNAHFKVCGVFCYAMFF